MKKISTYNDKAVSIPNEVYDLIMEARGNENIRIPLEKIEELSNKTYKSVNIIFLDKQENSRDGVIEHQYSIEEVDEDGDIIELVYGTEEHKRIEEIKDDIRHFDEITHREKLRKYKNGDEVYTPMSGCLGGKIVDCFENTFYKVNYRYIGRIPYSSKTEERESTSWFFVFDLQSIHNETSFTREKHWMDDLHINSYKKEIEFLFDMYIENYLDIKPEYQRDLVWSMQQKEDLIESIFEKRNTGSLTIIQHPNYDYEIIDGLQRVSTVFDYTMDKFPYKGKYYSELGRKDRNTIDHHKFQYAEICPRNELTTEEKVEIFIQLNTCGVPVSKEHIENLKNKYLK